MIDFIPNTEEDFEFSNLFESFSTPGIKDYSIQNYPFSNICYFYLEREKLPIEELQIDERKIEQFDIFKNIFIRGDFFYLIAYHYFLNVTYYQFDSKNEGKIVMKGLNGNNKTISFFHPLYQALSKEREKSKVLLRHEYILSENKFGYINKLIELLFENYRDLDECIRKEKNVFSKFGITIKEVYLEIFKDFYSNFIDYLSNENFETLKTLVYPSKKEVQSFKLATRKNYRNLNDKEARLRIIGAVHESLMVKEFVSPDTTFEQIDDLFNNKRRELQKIIWLKNVTALATFYKIMEEDKIVQNSEGKHWKILSDYFILKKGSEISREELKIKKISTNIIMIEELRNVFYMLKRIVA